MLLRENKDLRFCVCDFETTHLNLKTTLPWQFSAVVCDCKGRIYRQEDLFIKWDNLNMSKEAVEVTRFDEKKYKERAVDAKETLDIINDLFDSSDYVCGHNVLGFDFFVYYNYCYKYGVAPIRVEKKVIDTLPLFKGLKLDIPYRAGDDFSLYQYKLLNEVVKKRGFATLKAMAQEFGVEFDPDKAHDALYDVQKNAECLIKILWKIDK